MQELLAKECWVAARDAGGRERVNASAVFAVLT